MSSGNLPPWIIDDPVPGFLRVFRKGEFIEFSPRQDDSPVALEYLSMVDRAGLTPRYAWTKYDRFAPVVMVALGRRTATSPALPDKLRVSLTPTQQNQVNEVAREASQLNEQYNRIVTAWEKQSSDEKSWEMMKILADRASQYLDACLHHAQHGSANGFKLAMSLSIGFVSTNVSLANDYIKSLDTAPHLVKMIASCTALGFSVYSTLSTAPAILSGQPLAAGAGLALGGIGLVSLSKEYKQCFSQLGLDRAVELFEMESRTRQLMQGTARDPMPQGIDYYFRDGSDIKVCRGSAESTVDISDPLQSEIKLMFPDLPGTGRAVERTNNERERAYDIKVELDPVPGLDDRGPFETRCVLDKEDGTCTLL
jgi:hypothetical protein